MIQFPGRISQPNEIDPTNQYSTWGQIKSGQLCHKRMHIGNIKIHDQRNKPHFVEGSWPETTDHHESFLLIGASSLPDLSSQPNNLMLFTLCSLTYERKQKKNSVDRAVRKRTSPPYKWARRKVRSHLAVSYGIQALAHCSIHEDHVGPPHKAYVHLREWTAPGDPRRDKQQRVNHPYKTQHLPDAHTNMHINSGVTSMGDLLSR